MGSFNTVRIVGKQPVYAKGREFGDFVGVVDGPDVDFEAAGVGIGDEFGGDEFVAHAGVGRLGLEREFSQTYRDAGDQGAGRDLGSEAVEFEELVMIERRDFEICVTPVTLGDMELDKLVDGLGRAWDFEFDVDFGAAVHEIEHLLERGELFAFTGIQAACFIKSQVCDVPFAVRRAVNGLIVQDDKFAGPAELDI